MLFDLLIRTYLVLYSELLICEARTVRPYRDETSGSIAIYSGSVDASTYGR